MPKIVKPLSQTQVLNAKAKEKDYKLSDGGGMYLLVKKIGTKMWRLDYSFDGKRKTLSLGTYPEISLKEARDKREDLRKVIANGLDPSKERKKAKIREADGANSFEVITKAYLATKEDITKQHKEKLYRQIERDIIPYVGVKDIGSLDALEFLSIIKKIEERGSVETAHRTLSLCNRIYRYAVTTGRASHNVIADIDGRIALKSVKRKNYPHTTDIKTLQLMLGSFEEYDGWIGTRNALRMLPYVFVRPFNIRYAEWEEFDFDRKEWRIPAEKMKMKREHIVPLTDTVISIIKEMVPFANDSKYLFPSDIGNAKPLSENTLNQAIKRSGYGDVTVAHGFRHTASTLLHEHMHEHGVSSDAIEMQMAHTKSDVKSVYNKALYIKEREKLMQWYSDFLDGLKKPE